MKISKAILSTAFCALTLAQALPAHAENEGKGAIIGGIIGGLLGNKAGHGKAGGTIIGAIIGGAIGAGIAHDLSENDRREVSRARGDCLEGRHRSEWRGRDSDAYGSINVLQEGYYVNDPSMVCRSYESTTTFRGRTETTRGSACRDAYGNWNEVRETEITYGGYNPRPSPLPPPQAPRYGGGYGRPMPPPPPPMMAQVRCMPYQYTGMLVDNYTNMQVAIYSDMGACQTALMNQRGSLICIQSGYQSYAIDLRTRQSVGYSYRDLGECLRNLR